MFSSQSDDVLIDFPSTEEKKNSVPDGFEIVDETIPTSNIDLTLFSSDLKRYDPNHLYFSIITGLVQDKKVTKIDMEIMPYIETQMVFFTIKMKDNSEIILFSTTHDKWNQDSGDLSTWPSLIDVVNNISSSKDNRFNNKLLIFPFAQLRPLKFFNLFYNEARYHWAAYVIDGRNKEVIHYLVDPKSDSSAITKYDTEHFKEINQDCNIKNLKHQSLLDTNNCGKYLSFWLERFIINPNLIKKDTFDQDKLPIENICNRHKNYETFFKAFLEKNQQKPLFSSMFNVNSFPQLLGEETVKSFNKLINDSSFRDYFKSKLNDEISILDDEEDEKNNKVPGVPAPKISTENAEEIAKENIENPLNQQNNICPGIEVPNVPATNISIEKPEDKCIKGIINFINEKQSWETGVITFSSIPPSTSTSWKYPDIKAPRGIQLICECIDNEKLNSFEKLEEIKRIVTSRQGNRIFSCCLWARSNDTKNAYKEIIEKLLLLSTALKVHEPSATVIRNSRY